MTETHETDEFEGWARLAASIGQYTQQRDGDTPPPDGESPPKGVAVNGHQTMNGRANDNGVKVDRLPNFLLQGPAIDDDPQANEVARAATATKKNGTARPPVEVVDSSAAAPFVLVDVLSEDLEIPPEPATPPMNELKRPVQRTVIREAMDAQQQQLTAAKPTAIGSRQSSQHAVGREANGTAEWPPVVVRPRQVEPPRRDFDGLPSSPPSVKRVGISASRPAERRVLLRHRFRRWLQKGAAATAVGVTIGGVAAAVLYIVIAATMAVVVI